MEILPSFFPRAGRICGGVTYIGLCRCMFVGSSNSLIVRKIVDGDR
jgi:hypothetical protein